MPDITMCKDDECPSRKDCYRFMAEPNPRRQSYFAESPRPKTFAQIKRTEGCEMFRRITDRKVKPIVWEN